MTSLGRNLIIALTALGLAGCTPPENRLTNAARNDDLATFQRILAKAPGAVDKPEKGMLGYTALTAAALTDGTDVFNFLLKSKVNVNARNRDTKTPLMMAIMKGDGNMAKVVALVEAGADVNARDGKGISVLQYAGAALAPQIAAMLRACGAREG